MGKLTNVFRGKKLFPLWGSSKWKQLLKVEKEITNVSRVVSTLEALKVETTWEAGKKKKKLTSELFPLWGPSEWKQL